MPRAARQIVGDPDGGAGAERLPLPPCSCMDGCVITAHVATPALAGCIMTYHECMRNRRRGMQEARWGLGSTPSPHWPPAQPSPSLQLLMWHRRQPPRLGLASMWARRRRRVRTPRRSQSRRPARPPLRTRRPGQASTGNQRRQTVPHSRWQPGVHAHAPSPCGRGPHACMHVLHIQRPRHPQRSAVPAPNSWWNTERARLQARAAGCLAAAFGCRHAHGRLQVAGGCRACPGGSAGPPGLRARPASPWPRLHHHRETGDGQRGRSHGTRPGGILPSCRGRRWPGVHSGIKAARGPCHCGRRGSGSCRVRPAGACADLPHALSPCVVLTAAWQP